MITRAFAPVALILLLLAGCGADTRDLEGVKARNPQKTELYVNVNQHPNLVRLCIDGVAFVTSSREEDPILRVPEFDAWCKS